jgi:hypothetical protein
MGEPSPVGGAKASGPIDVCSQAAREGAPRAPRSRDGCAALIVVKA